ncbi:carboxypeptidase-like regulatory domain-containing protein [Myxococcus qinghaiensis]|uniref:carboxypeptidase-like regulatory domain-containing protein n=1 Tax=Myxococcus qinghaiensis TaxID=2906758 RepID=UPI0020A73054|nr:carboxypeptidase-like regulatory domain-containing protein [Myxococcus qinghaiensis]MCP3168529.1 carboxypeptidase-like regulatory domain-containing protein [Myxococcus qinghaiensis]
MLSTKAVLRNLPSLVMALCLGLGSSVMAQEYQRFAGRLSDKNTGAALVSTISVNGVRKATTSNGSFEIYVPTAARYVLDASLNGYIPTSLIHTSLPPEHLEVQLTKAETFAINPTQNVDVTDSRGTRITIPAGSLVDSLGRPAPSSVQLQLYTYDLRNEQMVGDMSAIDSNGQPVALVSVGAFSAEFRDSAGTFYNLASGRSAGISLRADPGSAFSGAVPLWWYDQTRGVWVEEGVGTVTDGVATGQVRHFTVWNFDIKLAAPACIKLAIDPTFFYASLGGSANVRLNVVGTAQSRSGTVTTPGPHATYNLPPHTNVEVFINNVPYGVVNTGAPWGGTGTPTYPYDVCNGKMLNINASTVQTGTLKGKVLRQHRTSHGGVTVTAYRGSTPVGSVVTDAAGNFSVQVSAGTTSVIAARSGYLSAQRATFSLAAGATMELPTVQLFAGNTDGDNDIDWNDINAIGSAVTNPLTAVGSNDPRDVNGNGFIDWDDSTKASANGGFVGPRIW